MGMDDELDPVAVEEEQRLEDHNEEEDALALFGGRPDSAAINIDDAPCSLCRWSDGHRLHKPDTDRHKHCCHKF